MSTALNTDRYELTMLQAALKSGKAQRKCVFEVFTRQLPAGRRYGVVAGTGRVLEAIQNFRFEEKELDFLRTNSVVDESTLTWLANYKFSGNVFGYREGGTLLRPVSGPHCGGQLCGSRNSGNCDSLDPEL